MELGSSQGLLLAVFASEDERRIVSGVAQQVLGNVQGGVGKESDMTKLVGRLDQTGAAVPAHATEIPDISPELGGLGHRPGVQSKV